MEINHCLPGFLFPFLKYPVLPEYCCCIWGGLQGEGDWGIWYCSAPGGCKKPTEGLRKRGRKKRSIRAGDHHDGDNTVFLLREDHS